ncbi:MAG: OmpH family outer membrane protein [Bacteroidetes bacterium]|nr:OmpH family outer membrane protein [Bacteroidota bacterium]
MKTIFQKSLIVLYVLLITPLTNYAQKFAYVDTEYILSLLPEYKSAQKKLDELAEQWQKEIDKKYDDIDKMYKEYQAEKVLLTAEQQKQREDEIITKEKEAKKFQQDKFGYEGELFKKRQELVKPIQDKIFEAIQKLAKDEGFDFIFDKSSDMTMLFSNAKYDKSDNVLSSLGVVPTKEEKDKAKEKKNNEFPPDNDGVPPR